MGKSDYILAVGNWNKLAIWNYFDSSIPARYIDVGYSRISQVSILPANRHLVVATEHKISLVYVDILPCTDPLALTCEVQNADFSLTCLPNAEVIPFTINGNDFQRCFCNDGSEYEFTTLSCEVSPNPICKDFLAETCEGSEYEDTLTCVPRAIHDKLVERCRCAPTSYFENSIQTQLTRDYCPPCPTSTLCSGNTIAEQGIEPFALKIGEYPFRHYHGMCLVETDSFIGAVAVETNNANVY
jgi:hypothetical protein